MSGPVKVVKTKLFIGNLDPATQPTELTELFSSFGSVLEASVIKDYGFIHFGSIEEAEKAAAALNNKEFHGKRLRVELSTSTVRHRPGQPEPASALRNSRTRAAVMGGGNGVSRYNPAAPAGGVGPIRHSASAWVRSDSRPYDGMPLDPAALNPAYGPAPSAYDRPRAYDARTDPRHYYAGRGDSAYGPGYDASRDSAYGAPGYGGSSGGQAGMFSVRDYRDLPPPHARVESMNYDHSRMYDRNQETSPVDPYYAAGVPQGAVDPYHSYDPYQKYYASRPRDAEFAVPTSQNPPSRDYDPYANYRPDPYGATNGQPPLRHDAQVAFTQQQAAYPSANQQRQQQQQAYGNTSAPSYPPTLTQYYGAQQRA